LDVGAVAELVHPRLVAADRAAELRGEALTVAQVWAIGQQDAVGAPVAGDLLDAALGHARVDQRRGLDGEVRVDLCPDPLVVCGPVEHTGEHLVHVGSRTSILRWGRPEPSGTASGPSLESRPCAPRT